MRRDFIEDVSFLLVEKNRAVSKLFVELRIF